MEGAVAVGEVAVERAAVGGDEALGDAQAPPRQLHLTHPTPFPFIPSLPSLPSLTWSRRSVESSATFSVSPRVLGFQEEEKKACGEEEGDKVWESEGMLAQAPCGTWGSPR